MYLYDRCTNILVLSCPLSSVLISHGTARKLPFNKIVWWVSGISERRCAANTVKITHIHIIDQEYVTPMDEIGIMLLKYWEIVYASVKLKNTEITLLMNE